MEGFIKDTLFTNAKSGRETLKFALSSKPPRHEGIPFNTVWLRVAGPSVCPFTWATFSYIGGRYASPNTPHAKQRYSIDRATTISEGAAVIG